MSKENQYVSFDKPHSRAGVEIFMRKGADMRADLVQKILSSMSIALAKPDGEDSSGRTKYSVMNPVDVADRACQIAEYAFEEMQRRGWIYDIPLADELPKKEDQ